MEISKQCHPQKRFGYDVVIRVETKEDEASLMATLDYLTSKVDRNKWAKRGELIPLAS